MDEYGIINKTPKDSLYLYNLRESFFRGFKYEDVLKMKITIAKRRIQNIMEKQFEMDREEYFEKEALLNDLIKAKEFNEKLLEQVMKEEEDETSR